MTEHTTIRVDGPRPYTVTVGAELLRNATTWQLQSAKQFALITDHHVGPLYLKAVHEGLTAAHPDAQILSLTLDAGEASKNWQQLGNVLEQLADAGMRRDAVVLALGGGVIGDLAGLAAALWMRGIDCIQVPTSLLAMVDSSVGGKTAVDLPHGKNLIGAFHPPRHVIADVATLTTLPAREFAAGMAEVIKYGAAFDREFMQWLQQHAAEITARDAATLTELVARCIRYKAAIVARDPTERGERALLNFGHTFGHALEVMAGYGDALLHGEAVAIGMVQAARHSESALQLPAADTQQLIDTLQRFGLPTEPPAGTDPQTQKHHMRLDKKNTGSALRLILLQQLGRAVIHQSPL
ncbi:3-dehydroquinate synthase [Luteimonas sp. FXH3W]|uniref:3-dehydroquinate synthase n=1 Tax=Aquilutibacter rugosus TaxID=3115820 RepID=A0ABU7UYF0_9GAMM